MLSARWIRPAWRNIAETNRQYWWSSAMAGGYMAPRSNSFCTFGPAKREF